MKKLNPEKLKEQQAFFELWKSSGAKGTLVAVTGFGKTTVGLITIKDMNSRHPKRTTHVVVPTIELKNQWEKEIFEWSLSNVEVFVINTYITDSRRCNLLILDEIHRYGSFMFQNVFVVSKYNFILGLTATIERQDGNDQLITHYAPVLKRINLKHALEKNYISNFLVFNLGVKMSVFEKRKYKQVNHKFDYYFAQFNHDFDAAMLALRSKDFREQFAKQEGIEQDEVYVNAVNFVRNLGERKKLLYESDAKLAAVKEIIKAFDNKMIIFSETADFADRVVNISEGKAFAYHTKVSDKKQMKQRLKDFKNSEGFNIVSAVKAIEEGLDVEDLEMAVLVSGNSTKRQYIQRIGRSLRSQPGKVAVIINIYIHGTQDENWLKRRQFSNNFNIFWVNDISQIRGLVSEYSNGDIKKLQSDLHKYKHAES
jgi:superfamily II DNA or RNA helicase